MTIPEPPRQAHRNETILHIVLPVVGGGLLIVAAVVIALVLQRRAQVHIVADVLTTILLLCPLLMCFFPFYLLFVVLALATGRLHDGTIPYLEKVQNFTATISQRTHDIMSYITKQIININVKIEPFLEKLDIFEKRNPQGKDK